MRNKFDHIDETTYPNDLSAQYGADEQLASTYILSPQQLIENFRQDEAEKYMQFCIDNPGYVMHNSAIREKTCTDILDMINDITDKNEVIKLIQAKRERAMDAYKVSTGPNGHWITAGTCDTILQLLSQI